MFATTDASSLRLRLRRRRRSLRTKPRLKIDGDVHGHGIPWSTTRAPSPRTGAESVNLVSAIERRYGLIDHEADG